MIYLLLGENTFQRDLEVARLIADRAVERVDAETLSPDRLGELFTGQTLFSPDVIKIIDGVSANKSVWEELAAWVDKTIESDIILLEQKIDKRTKTYKVLQKQAKVINLDYWTEQQRGLARRWLSNYAAEQETTLPDDLIDDMIARAIRPSDTSSNAVIDQQRLARAVQQLRHAEVINTQAIDTVMAPSINENAFELLSRALDGETAHVRTMIGRLSQNQDGHRMMGLLSSQLANLAALVLAGDRSLDQVARDIGAHPFALKQMNRFRSRFGRPEIASIVKSLAGADLRLKRSQAEPWVLIEIALAEISLVQSKTRP